MTITHQDTPPRYATLGAESVRQEVAMRCFEALVPRFCSGDPVPTVDAALAQRAWGLADAFVVEWEKWNDALVFEDPR